MRNSSSLEAFIGLSFQVTLTEFLGKIVKSKNEGPTLIHLLLPKGTIPLSPLWREVELAQALVPFHFSLTPAWALVSTVCRISQRALSANAVAGAVLHHVLTAMLGRARPLRICSRGLMKCAIAAPLYRFGHCFKEVKLCPSHTARKCWTPDRVRGSQPLLPGGCAALTLKESQSIICSLFNFRHSVLISCLTRISPSVYTLPPPPSVP